MSSERAVVNYNDFQHIVSDEEFKNFTKNYHGDRSTQLAIFIYRCEQKAITKHIRKIEKLAEAVKEAIFGVSKKQKPQDNPKLRVIEALRGIDGTTAYDILSDLQLEIRKQSLGKFIV